VPERPASPVARDHPSAAHAMQAPTQQAGGPVVECSGLTRDFGSLRAVDGIDLTVPRGAVFGFLGPNGAGKTTTIRLLLGLLRPTAGQVRVLGYALPRDGEEVRRRTGTVLEHHGLYEGLTVRASLEFAGETYGLERAAARTRVDEVVGRLGLADRLDERPQVLSRGMRQRMAVARALLARPELLVLDEPTNGLDPEAAAALRREILDLAGGGTTVFLATHLLSEAERMCDLVAVVKQGRIIASGTPTDLRRETTVHHVLIEGPAVAHIWAGEAEPGAAWSAPDPNTVRVAVAGLDAIPAVVTRLAAAGARIHRVEPEGQTLEAAFLRLISEQTEQQGEGAVSPGEGVGGWAGEPPEPGDAAPVVGGWAGEPPDGRGAPADNEGAGS
jgi:ABC-2 type transport system ATP-binding protein